MFQRCCLMLVFVSLLSSAAPAAARSESLTPADLAAMTLTPADLEAVGWADLGLTSGQILEAPIRLSHGNGGTALTVEDGIAGFDDEAIAVTLDRDFGHDGIEVYHTSAVLFRSGAVVAKIGLTRVYDPPSMSATKELAAAQAACLATTHCLSTLPVPDSLKGAHARETVESPVSAQI